MGRGFTVLELLVIGAIFALAGTVVVAMMRDTAKKSRDMRRLETMQVLKKSLAEYYVKTNRFPVASKPVVLNGSDTIIQALMTSGMLDRFDADPSSPQYDYRYKASTPSTYTITFCLESNTAPPPYTPGCANILSP